MPTSPNLVAAVEHVRGQSTVALDEAIHSMLSAVRTHLGMGAAFVSEFSEGRRWLRYVDADGEDCPIKVGMSDPLEDSYCQRVVDGRLPALIKDTALNAEARTLAVTRALPVGSHISVPIRFSDGSIFGTFCCWDPEPNLGLVERDAAVMEMLAQFLAGRLEREMCAVAQIEKQRARVQHVLDARALHTVFQPIVCLRDSAIVGHEALTRFEGEQRAPSIWFGEAEEVGLGVELELLAMRVALEQLDNRPRGTYVSVNVSPAALIAPGTLEALLAYPLNSVVIELTEHAGVDDYPKLMNITATLQAAGARIAVDDAGSGFASLSHILELRPDFIKLDLTLTRFVSKDLARQALVEALVRFAERCGSKIVAEGVEYRDDAAKLLELGVKYVQGYYFGRPLPEFTQCVTVPKEIESKSAFA